MRRAITDKAVEKGLGRFLTLTLNPNTCAPEESAAYIMRCWSKFRTYLKRRFRTRVSYIAVLELQKSGYAHLHILVDRYVDQHWISDAWSALGGGRVVDIRMVDLHRIGSYLSKYLTKNVLLGGLQPRQRRYSTSWDISLSRKAEPGAWTLIKLTLEILYREVLGGVIREKLDEDGALLWFEVADVFPDQKGFFH